MDIEEKKRLLQKRRLLEEKRAKEQPQEESQDQGLLKRAGQGALNTLGAIGEGLNRYSAAPGRAAVGAAIEGKNPLEAFSNQFGEDPSQAPSGADIMQKVGVPNKDYMAGQTSMTPDELKNWNEKFNPGMAISLKQAGLTGTEKVPLNPAKIGGVGVELAADPLNALPIVSKGLGLISKIPGVSKGIGVVGKGAAKVGEALTGIPENEITTYAKHADEIKQMAKASDNNVAEAADQMREKFSQSIQNTRKNLSNQIGETLKNSQKSANIDPILQAMTKEQDLINPILYPEEFNQVKDLKKRIQLLADKEGNIPIQKLNEVKKFLQETASSAYMRPGQIFSVGPNAARSAKQGARISKDLINELEPAVKEANEGLSNLHNIEDDLNINIISPGRPEAGLLAAGSGGNLRNRNALEELSKATGHNMVEDAEKLSSMRTFGNPKLMPMDTTGKSVARMLPGILTGNAVAGPAGGLAGAALSSPLTLRSLIDMGLLTKEAAQSMSTPQLNTLLGAGLLKQLNQQQEK